MRILVGLGNPGAEYKMTRHNAGVRLVEMMAEQIVSDYGWRKRKNIMVYETRSWTLVKSSEVFMNESGKMVMGYEFMVHGGDDLWVAHDDLDLQLGNFKIQHGTGPKVHGGINSIEQHLKTKDFWRVRIGIENRSPILRTPGEQYVLQRFSPEENQILNETLGKIVKELLKI